MNKGGFSWKRFIGITRIKQNISRRIGIPLTRSGRQRKLGAMIIGKGCLFIIAMGGLITTLTIFILWL